MLSQKVKSQIAMSNTEHGRFLKDQDAQHDQSAQQSQQPDTVGDTAEGNQDGTGRVDEVYNELIHMRKMNRVLGQRIKQLEV